MIAPASQIPSRANKQVRGTDGNIWCHARGPSKTEMTMKNTLLSATILALVASTTANAAPKPGSGPKGGGFQPSNVIRSLPIQNIGKPNGPMPSGQVLNLHTQTTQMLNLHTPAGQMLNLHTPTGQVLNLHNIGVQINPLLKTGNGQPHGVQLLGPQHSSFKTFTPFCYPYHYCYYPWWFGWGYWGYPSYFWWDYSYFPFYGF
jgi:hypothetical protein